MSTTTAKGQAFVDLVSEVAYHIRKAHVISQQGQDIYNALDMGTWIVAAEEDPDGNIAGTQVTKAELNAASQSIVKLVDFLENRAPTQGDHLANLLRCTNSDAIVPR